MIMEPVLLQIEGAIAHITLNRPAQLNAMDTPTLAALHQALKAAAADNAVRAVLLRARGKFFSVGGDLGFFSETLKGSAEEKHRIFSQLIDEAHAVIQLITTLRVPVVVAVQGGAAGVSLSLIAACDFVLTTRQSTFSTAYMGLGATPDGGSTWLLPRLLGLRKARELIMLSERFSGEEALSLGLVNRLVEPEVLENEAQALAGRLAQGPTAAYGRLKKLLADSLQTDLPTQLDAEKGSFLASTAGADLPEGVRAFLAKEPPNFQGQ